MSVVADTPTFTIVIAVLNAAETMQRCIDSLACQSTDNWELVILDGGSSDGTVEIVRQNEALVQYFDSAPDDGIADAWNKGIRVARGRWVLFLGADDLLAEPTVLAQAAQRLKNVAPHQRIAYGMVDVVSAAGNLVQRAGGPWHILQQQILVEMTLPHQGVFHRRQIFAENGFDCNFSIAADYELMLRELANDAPLYLGDIVITRMLEGGISNRLSSQYRSLLDMARARKKHGYPPYPARWVRLYLLALVKMAASRVLGEQLAKRLANTLRPPQLP